MTDVWIVDALRTPIGRYGGELATVRPDDLAARVIAAAVERNGVDGSAIEDVFFGCTNQAGEDNRNVARMGSLLAGLPVEVPGVTVNRLCASGLEAISQGARSLKAGDGDIVLAGGVESMTRSPFVMLKPDRAFPRNAPRAGGHDDRLAVHQPADGRELLDRVDGRDGGERRRALRRVARGPGRVRARVPPPRDRRPGGRQVRRGDRHRGRAAAEGAARDGPLRRGPASRHARSRSSRSCARSSATAAPSPPATRRRSTTAPPAWCSPRTTASSSSAIPSRSRGWSRSAPRASTPPTWASAPCRRCARRSTAPG